MSISRFEKDLTIRIVLSNAVLFLCWAQALLFSNQMLMDSVIGGRSVVYASQTGLIPDQLLLTMAPLIVNTFLFSDVVLRNLSRRGSLIISRITIKKIISYGFMNLVRTVFLANVPAIFIMLVIKFFIQPQGLSASFLVFVVQSTALLLISVIAWQSVCVFIHRFTNHINASIFVIFVLLVCSSMLLILGPDSPLSRFNPMVYTWLARGASDGGMAMLFINPWIFVSSLLYFLFAAGLCQFIALYQSHLYESY